MDDLHVDGELAATVVEDEDTEAATAGLESVVEAGVQVGLVNDGEALLDVAGLGHGDDVALLHVKDTVLLEDRAEHGLDNDAGGRVRDERGLLVELLGEEVDTEVAVLAGGGRGGDSDDLAGAALEHQEITEADVVARDGDGVGEVVVAGRTLADDVDLDMLMASGANDLIVLVVVTHLVLLLGARKLGWLDGLFRDLHVRLVCGTRNRSVNGELVDLGLLVVGLTGSTGINGEVDLGRLLVVGLARGTGINSEVVDLGLLGSVLLLGTGTFNGEVVDLGLLSSLALSGSGVSFDGVVVDLEGVGGLVLGARRGVYAVVGLEVGTETLAVFTLGDVNGGGVVGMTGVDLYVSGVRSCVFRRRFRSTFLSDVFLVVIFLALVTGTVVTFFFTRDVYLFFAVLVLLFTRRNNFSCRSVRRVLTFPSGCRRLGLDLNLFVHLGGGCGLSLGFVVPICRWEDAEGDGDSSLKVQVGDFYGRERIFSYNLPREARKADKKNPLALVPKNKSRKKRKRDGRLW